MVGRTEELEKPLLLRMWGVPFQAIARCFGRDAMYWYRCFRSLGRFHLVGTTVKTQAALPQPLTVDEKHTRLYGEKNYIATVVSGGCFLGASIEESASTEALIPSVCPRTQADSADFSTRNGHDGRLGGNKRSDACAVWREHSDSVLFAQLAFDSRPMPPRPWAA